MGARKNPIVAPLDPPVEVSDQEIQEYHRLANMTEKSCPPGMKWKRTVALVHLKEHGLIPKTPEEIANEEAYKKREQARAAQAVEPVALGIPLKTPLEAQREKLGGPRMGPQVLVGGAKQPTTVPRNIDAEQALLSALLKDDAQAEAIARMLTRDDFYSYGNADLFATMAELAQAGRRFDATILVDALKRSSRLDKVGGEEFVEALIKKDAKPDQLLVYAGIIREESRRRALTRDLAQISADLLAGRLTAPEAGERMASVASSIPLLDEPELAQAEADFAPTWPVMSKSAHHGLVGELLAEIAPRTEADPSAILGQLLAALGNVIGRSAHWSHGATRNFLNLYIGIIGGTGSGKGTSWSIVTWLFGMVDPEWLDRCVKDGGLSTGEGLINEIRDESFTEANGLSKGVEDKRVLYVEEEMSAVLEVMARKGNTLNSMIRKAKDGRSLRSAPKGSPSSATNPHITLVAHSTFEEFRSAFSVRDKSNGFANRWLWMVSRRTNELPDGGRLLELEPVLKPILARLEKAIKFATSKAVSKRPIGFDAKALDFWHSKYAFLSRERPAPLGPVLARARSHVRDLAVLYALLDHSSVIKLDHLRAALAVWDYCERSAALIFGEGEPDPLADKILTALRESGSDGLTRDTLRRSHFQRMPAKDLEAVLLGMERTGLVERRLLKTGGRPSIVWALPYSPRGIEPRCGICGKGGGSSQCVCKKQVEARTFRIKGDAVMMRKGGK